MGQIPQKQAQNFNPNDYTAQLILDGKSFNASVDRAPNILSSDNRVREIILMPSEETGHSLYAGMFLQAKLISKEVQPLYKVSDDMLENGNILRLVNNENIIKRHKVDILSSDDGVFYVPSLGRDIKIVIGTNSGLIDGMTVNVIGQE